MEKDEAERFAAHPHCADAVRVRCWDEEGKDPDADVPGFDHYRAMLAALVDVRTRMSEWHVAQINIGRMRDGIDHPRMAHFVAALQPINALADQSPGFVWRLLTGEGDSTAWGGSMIRCFW